MKILISTLSISFLLFFWGSAISLAQSKIEKTFEGISQLEIEGGSIEVSYQGDPTKTSIEVIADMGNDEESDKNVFFVTIGSTLKISYQPHLSNWKNHHSSKKYIHITGPKEIKLRASNSSGKMLIANVQSELTELRANSGMLEIENIEGDLLLQGSSGKIFARNIEGKVTCQMGSGIAELESIKGNADLVAGSGQLKARHIDGELNVNISSGSASLEDVTSLGQLKLSSGLINAKHVGIGPNSSFYGSSGAFKIKVTTLLDQFNYDFSAGSGFVKVGNLSSTDHLVIDHGAAHTIKGKIGSGMISIEEL
ncbi:hypothetical protein GCM10028791_03510 [Echinicola sediminis]